LRNKIKSEHIFYCVGIITKVETAAVVPPSGGNVTMHPLHSLCVCVCDSSPRSLSSGQRGASDAEDEDEHQEGLGAPVSRAVSLII